MPDITSITAVLAGLKTATDIAKALREMDVTFEKAEAKLQLAELMSALADAKISAADTQLLIEEKEQTIRELRSALKRTATVVRHGDAYYETDVDGMPDGAPYCSRCWEVGHQLVHVHADRLHKQSICPECKSTVNFQWPLKSGKRPGSG